MCTHVRQHQCNSGTSNYLKLEYFVVFYYYLLIKNIPFARYVCHYEINRTLPSLNDILKCAAILHVASSAFETKRREKLMTKAYFLYSVILDTLNSLNKHFIVKKYSNRETFHLSPLSFHSSFVHSIYLRFQAQTKHFIVKVNECDEFK